MKILRVIASIDRGQGGVAESAWQVDAALRLQGHQVTLATLDDPSAAFVREYPATVKAFDAGRGYKFSPKLYSWLKEHVGQFDVVIIDGLWQFHGFATWVAIKKSRVKPPYFVFTHGMLDPWFKRAYPLKHLKKWIYWPWAEYRVLRDAAAVLFTCEEEKRLARDSFWLYRCNEIVTTFGTSAPPADGPRLRESFLSNNSDLRGKRIILFLGRIHEKKGCDLLVEAFAKVASRDPDLHLLMAGPDQAGWVAKLKCQAQRLGVSERITWTGMLQGDGKWGAFYTAEVFCLPSHQENFGIVVAEAMACGKPVLISNKVNIWREIEGDSAGVVQDDTLEGTTKALEQWLALTPEAQKEMQDAALRSFDARFRIDRVAESLVRILEQNAGLRSRDHAQIGRGALT